MLFDVMSDADMDYIIDIGPEGGSKGGKIIAVGNPEEVAKNAEVSGSYTGKFLKKELKISK